MCIEYMRRLHFSRLILTAAAGALVVSAAQASDGIETAGEVLRIALPLTAGGLSFARDDYDGVLQLSASEVASFGTSFLLQRLIREDRPDHTGSHAFPSDSSAMAFSAASYLQIRYGWNYGLPAYAVAAFVGYSRVEADKHNWGDVIAGAAIGWAFSEITTIRYYPPIRVTPGFGGTPLGFTLAATW
jgi:membrane-associated phospholipid phosphatase